MPINESSLDLYPAHKYQNFVLISTFSYIRLLGRFQFILSTGFKSNVNQHLNFIDRRWLG